MPEKPTHCCYCGSRFTANATWPRTCPSCGRTSYRNPLPVVVVLLPAGPGLVVIRRNIEPSLGTLTLPGGYLDCGETWQQGARRELLEETGIDIPAEAIRLYAVETGLDDTLVIFGLAERQPAEVVKPYSSSETQEVTRIDRPQDLGFPNHTVVVARYFAEVDNGSEGK